jgi:hypothetical protein
MEKNANRNSFSFKMKEIDQGETINTQKNQVFHKSISSKLRIFGKKTHLCSLFSIFFDVVHVIMLMK